MIKSKAARLIIGSLAPPFLVGLVAGVLGDIVSDKYCQLGDQHCNSYTALLVPLAMVFGVVPSIFYSVLMEFGVREVLVWPRGHIGICRYLLDWAELQGVSLISPR